MQNVDVVIIGSGVIGLSLACGLYRSGLRVAIIEQKFTDTVSQDISSKIYASSINIASEKFLTYLEVWSSIVSENICRFHKMEIWEKDRLGRIVFDGNIMGYNYIGYIIDNNIIRQALWNKVQKHLNFIKIFSTTIKQINWGENDVFITLSDYETIAARLVIGADGINSLVRNKANIPLIWWNYRYHAVVTTVQTDEPHNSIVRKIFHDKSDSILVFLPLFNPYQCLILWYISPNRAKEMYKVEEKIFNKLLNIASDNCLGLCSVVSERNILSLTGCYARKFAGHRVVLVGDAAYTVHPLLEQGINFSFMDSVELIGTLRRLHYLGKDIGQYLYLRRYERSRKYNTAMIVSSMQILCELFKGTNPIKRILRDFSLKFVDICPFLKRKILYREMGIYDFPEDWLIK